MKQDDLDDPESIEWHDGRIPEFVGPSLDALYGSLYASLPQLAFGGLQGVSTYAVRGARRLHALFLFTRDGRHVRVINEGMQVSSDQIAAFARQLFGRMPGVGRIEFHAIASDRDSTGPWTLRFTLTEDIVVELPDSEPAYLQRLGKGTRKSLRQNQMRANALVHRVIPGGDVDAELVNRLVGFNHARLAAKQRSSALDGLAARRLLELVRARGMAGTVTVDGRLCAGTLACRIGDDVYSLVNAHDPAFDHLGMGHLGRHLMITWAIRSGARRFHLLGGNFSSKRACGAERRPLDHLAIYRSAWQMIRDLPHIGMLAWHAQRYRLGAAIDGDLPATNLPHWRRWLTVLARWLKDTRRTSLRWLRQRTTAPR